MGFGRGLTSAPRRGTLWTGVSAPPVTMLRRAGDGTLVPQATVVVPTGTHLPLPRTLTATERARALLGSNAMGVPDGNAQRSLLGDARDLFIEAVRQWHLGTPALPSAPEDSLDWASAESTGVPHLFVHIGPTLRARALLREMSVQGRIRSEHDWDGDPDTAPTSAFPAPRSLRGAHGSLSGAPRSLHSPPRSLRSRPRTRPGRR